MSGGASARVVGVDVARALALLGMMSVHLLPEVHGDGTLTPAFVVSAGRASALFAVLAGVGLALATGGPRPRLRPRLRVTAATLTRAVVVALTGLLLATLGPPVAVILVNYGLLFALACPLLGARPRTLLVTAAAWIVAAPLLSHAVRGHLPTGPGDQPSLSTLGEPVEMLTHLLLTGYYPVLLWAPYVLVGLAVGRLRLDDRVTVARIALAGLLLASAARIVSDVLLRWRGWAALDAAGPLGVMQPQLGLDQLQSRGQYGVPPTTTWWWQAVASPHTGTPFDLATTIGTALVVIGVCVLLAQAAARTSSAWLSAPRWAIAVLAAAGSMTLTLYSLHVVAADATVGTVTSDSARGRLLLTHVIAALLVAVLWKAPRPNRWRAGPTARAGRAVGLPGLAVGRRGPLEAVVAWASTLAADAAERHATTGAVDATDRPELGAEGSQAPTGETAPP
ncbi:MAG TPA: heparan-alpha-glucosaminide N-acetyltransferase domain-containing protein [Actinomycetales bacterium]|nr:heparan-alpha-glucosaminide N-acetyltransferase domain-containing protein [Actinomycetales bacterium]